MEITFIKASLDSNPINFLFLLQYIGKANIMMFALHVKALQTAKRELRESTLFPLSPTGSILSHFWNGMIFYSVYQG